MFALLCSLSLCNTLQHTATHCNTLQHTATHCNTLQHAATHCNTLPSILRCRVFSFTRAHTRTLSLSLLHTHDLPSSFSSVLVFPHFISSSNTGVEYVFSLHHTYNCYIHTATHCNTLQHTATHCNTRHHTASKLDLFICPTMDWNVIFCDCW